MSNEKNSGKWAGEVFDFVRFFKKTGASGFGLLLLEVGWLLLLMLVSRIAPNGDNPPPPVLILPNGATLPISQIILPGMILVFLVWFFVSEFYIYIWTPILTVLKYLASLVIMLLVFLVGVINLILLPITRTIVKQKIKYYWKNIPPKTKETVEKRLELREDRLRTLLTSNINLPDGRERIKKFFGKKMESVLYSNKYSTDQGAQIGNKIIHEIATKEIALEHITFNERFLIKWIWSVFEGFIIGVFSQANIGIAPIQSFNYDEDQSSTRLASQIFSIAVEWVRWALKDIDSLQYVKFSLLPEHIMPQNAIGAERLRSMLNLDVMIWGSYLAESKNNIWINTSVNLSSTKEEKKDVEKFKYEVLPKIFLNNFKIDPIILVINQNQPWDIFAVLVLSIVITLQSRNTPKRVFIDRLSNQNDKIDTIIIYLLRQTLLKIQHEDNNMPYPDLEKLIVEIAGDWIGHKMGMYILDDKNPKFIEENCSILYEIICNCIERQPNISENYYRAGALACFMGKKGDALQKYQKASSLNKGTIFESAYPQIYSEVRMAIFEASGLHIGASEKLVFSKLTAHIARAMNLLGTKMKQEIQEELDKSLNFSTLIEQENIDDVYLEVIKEILYSDVNSNSVSK